ncbi:MAG: hypothetical protein IJ111_12570 [Eggerthellaceae bacterium]|nr:hypothetical protein [Eggerthellaceae bacterium]
MAKKNKSKQGSASPVVHRPKTESDFRQLHRELSERRYVALDMLKPGRVRDISLAIGDAANAGASDMAASMGCGAWSNGPLSKVAWAFDGRTDTVEQVSDKDGNPLGLGYVKWGAGDNIPSVIPPLAMSSPYTAAPLRYISDLTTGLGVRYMYRFPDGSLIEFKLAGEILRAYVEELEAEEGINEVQTESDNSGNPAVSVLNGLAAEIQAKPSKELQRARDLLEDWEHTWYGYDGDDPEATAAPVHIVSARKFMEENNLDMHLITCEQDDPYLDIYYPTVGMERGRRGAWNPGIVQVGVLPAHSCRLERMNEYRHINHVYFSDSLRTKGAMGTQTATATQDRSFTLYSAAMPQHLLSDLRYIVESNQRTRIKDRPTWVVCPTYYPSGNKPYYPQPHWWSVFTSKAFDFAATILYDKYKQRDNATSFGKILYVSLDYLQMCYADMGIEGDPDKKQAFLDELDENVEQFLQQRENNGKMMRQFMWAGQGDKVNHNIEIVDVAQTKADTVKAGKEELELSTNPIFLALQVDPRDVGVPMVSASNGGTALREIRLMKQQQLNPKQRLYLNFLNTVARFNNWSEHGEFHIKQQTFSTLDRSNTGTVETIAGEGA